MGGNGPLHQQPAVKGGEKDRSWPGTLMAIGVFFTLVNVVTVVRWTLIEPTTLLRGLALLCFIGSVLPYRLAAFRLGMARLEWFLFNLLAVGPLLMGAALWTNFLFHGHTTTSDHRIAEVEGGSAFRKHTFTDGLWAEYPLARLLTREQSETMGIDVRITTAQGLFGVPVVVRIGSATGQRKASMGTV